MFDGVTNTMAAVMNVANSPHNPNVRIGELLNDATRSVSPG